MIPPISTSIFSAGIFPVLIAALSPTKSTTTAPVSSKTLRSLAPGPFCIIANAAITAIAAAAILRNLFLSSQNAAASPDVWLFTPSISYEIHRMSLMLRVSLGSPLLPSSIFRRLNDIQYPKPSSLPKVLSIDEFRGNAGGAKFQAILTDPKHHKILDILPDRSQTTLIDHIQGFPDRRDVRYFIMDMNRVYLDIARTFLPKATIVIDRFHVVRYVTWTLENVRKRVQKDMLPSKRRYFKRSRRILLSRRSHLSEENQLALEVMLQQSEDLAKAYYLKELFYHFMASETNQITKKRLHTFLLAAQVSDLEKLNAALTMLANWGKYIPVKFTPNT